MGKKHVTIRKATLTDTAAIAHVHVAAWRAAYKGLLPADLLANLSEERRNAWWQQMLKADLPENGIFLAELNQQIIGFVLSWPATDAEPEQNWGEIGAIYVLETVWGQGVGWKLWQAARAFFEAADYDTLMLWVLDGNERAIQFYEKIGFVQDRSPQGIKLEQLGEVTVREVRFLLQR